MQPDVVHVLSEPWGALSLHSLIVANSRRHPIPVCAHGADNVFNHGAKLERLIRRQVLAAALPRLAGLAAWTDEVIDLAHQFGLPGSTPTVVVPEEVPDPERFTPVSDSVRLAARHRLGLPARHRVVGFIGRLAAEKGVLDAIAAVRGLPGGSLTVLAIWGSGPLESQVRTFQGQDGDRVLYRGPLTLADVPIALQACDVMIIPSKVSSWWKEQFGRVALEAMFSGCAIVAYRSGALPYVLGDAAVLVDEGHLAGLTAALTRLLENDWERSELGRRARESALIRFHPQMLSDRMIDFWDRVR
jgi:glycosyltransferase involved in cell wall biosynthesis